MNRAITTKTRAAKRVGAMQPGTPAGAEPTELILRHWREAVPDDRLAHLVKDAARALVRALQMRLAQHAVPFGHWAFLRILWESDGLTQRALSREAGVMEPTTHVALTAMERSGYVVRRQAADNRRNIYVFLTPRGRALRRKLVPLAEDVNAIAVQRVAAADLAATRRTLLAIIENLARDEVLRDTRKPAPIRRTLPTAR
jgi:MarR family transcriptional regulator, organic hydroperoxide resistance regulator